MQVAIDNSKRRFDIDLGTEIRRIKNDMDIKENKYPNFWSIIKKGFNKNNINSHLLCPMNYLYDLKIKNYRNTLSTLPMSYYFKKHDLDLNRKTCKNIEEMISKYSLDLGINYNWLENKNDLQEEYLLLRSDFDELIRDLQKMHISKNYLGLMSWLIDRAFLITPNLKVNNKNIQSNLNKNKSILLKVLYECNKQGLFLIFSKNVTF